MGSVVTNGGRKVELAPLAAGAGYERGLRALALAPRWIGRLWRGLVKSVGTQTVYLVGPSPWAVRDQVRAGGGEERDGGPGRRPAAPETPDRSGSVEGVRRSSGRPAPLVGAR